MSAEASFIPIAPESYRAHRARGFSLLELAISVATVGVIAAIAVPRLGLAAERAAHRALVANHVELQKAVDLYAAEHMGRNPAQNADGSPNTDSLTVVRRLLQRSDITGAVAANGLFGPYLFTFPRNPFTDCAALRVDGAAAGQDCAWRITSATGKVEFDHSNTGVNRHDYYARHGALATLIPRSGPATQVTPTDESVLIDSEADEGELKAPLLIPD